ncbi:hypothetical protein [Mesorhizobium sp. f-mel]
MPKAKLKPGRQAQEIGASIVGTWLKALPHVITANITTMNARNPLRITVDRNVFASGNTIALRSVGKAGLRSVKVGMITGSTPSSQTFRIVDLSGGGIDYPADQPTLQGGAVAIVKDIEELHDDLKAVLEQIVEENVNVVFDAPGEITVVVPALPEAVLTRGDLIEYLREYHKHAQGRHYHDELATAVLFGCR